MTELVQHHRFVEGTPDRKTIIYGYAGLLHRVIDFTRGIDELPRLIGGPSGVGIAEDHRAFGNRRRNRRNPFNIVVNDATHLDLQAMKALRDYLFCIGRHRLDRTMCNDPVKICHIAFPAAEHCHKRNACRTRGQIRASHVECRLDIGVPLEHGVHQPVEPGQRARILPEKVRCDFGDTGLSSCRKGGGIEIAERCHLAPPGQPGVGGD